MNSIMLYPTIFAHSYALCPQPDKLKFVRFVPALRQTEVCADSQTEQSNARHGVANFTDYDDDDDNNSPQRPYPSLARRAQHDA